MSAHTSELPPPSTLSTISPAELAPPGPALNPLPGPIPSFQDLTDDSGSESDKGSEDWEAWVKAAEDAFTEQEITTMHDFLRERGLFAFLKRYLEDEGLNPSLLLLGLGVMVRPDTTSLADQMRMLKIACSRILRNREKLEAFNTPDDVVSLIRRSKKILILTGAGVSTSCGIPDFRSPTGLYARLKEDPLLNAELDDPQDMFDLAFFKEKPTVFYSFAKEIYPSNFVPSPCHRFVRLLELNDRLLRSYTQNIDGLFEQVGVEKMINCHGSFATASCLLCRRRFPGSAIEADVYASRVPLCPFCTADQQAEEAARAEEPPRKKKKKAHEWDDDSDEEEDERLAARGEWEGKALIKPDITFFGEALSDEFDRSLLADRDEVDLCIVMGTSLRVSPVAQLPSHLPHSIPQILINRDPVAHHQFDVCLLGDGDTIVKWLCEELSKPAPAGDTEDEQKDPLPPAEAAGDLWNLDKRVPVATPPHPSPSSSAVDPQPAPDAPFPSLPAAPPGAAPPFEPERVASSHVWLYPGANREARWVQAVRAAYEDADGESASGSGGDSDGAVELPASLAPGMPEGVPSDGEDDPDADDAASQEKGQDAAL
ncbi:hypothetical protein JCM10207_008077 [Rhodosporidiobolus poonsookiae]